jgi:hypothetical protein
MADRLFTVQGLPARRALWELRESALLRCLSAEQQRALGTWCTTTDVGKEWRGAWVGTEGRLTYVSVQRVA